MKYTKAALPLLLILALCQCDRIGAIFSPKAAPKGPYAYTLHLEVTPAAVAQMKAQDYHLNVHAFYYGRAKIPKAPNADELNRIELGYELNAFPGGAKVLNMAGEGINTHLFPQIEDGQPYVLITVHSVSRSNFETELLTCNNYIDQIAQARKAPPTIKCHMPDEAG